MTSTFASVNLPEVKYTPKTTLQAFGSLLTSGYMKYQTSTITDAAWKISVICTAAERAALLALAGTVGSLILDGTTYTNCLIKSWDKDDEINPTTWLVEFTIVKDSSL
jgi:hypothetical protein